MQQDERRVQEGLLMTVGELKKLLSVMPDDMKIQLVINSQDGTNFVRLRAVTKWPCIVEFVGDEDMDLADIEKEEKERKRHES
jgi:hypothetical protein